MHERMIVSPAGVHPSSNANHNEFLCHIGLMGLTSPAERRVVLPPCTAFAGSSGKLLSTKVAVRARVRGSLDAETPSTTLVELTSTIEKNHLPLRASYCTKGSEILSTPVPKNDAREVGGTRTLPARSHTSYA